MSDPLSDILELVHARCGISGRLVAGGAWSRRFANLDAIKFCAAIKGSVWWRLDGSDEPAPFRAGDILVMNGTGSLCLATSPDLLVEPDASPLVPEEDGVFRLGIGDDFVMVAGSVLVSDHSRSLLRGALPSALLVSAKAHEADRLRWLLDQLVAEMAPTPMPGQTVVAAELALLLFVTVLRAYLLCAPASDSGWLKGLGDRRLAPVLGRIHADPSRSWSLDAMARDAGMSRTTFAVHFRQVMGVPPLTYLTNWRMHLAERRLREGISVIQAADAVGYSSESAFSHAFKRAIGIAPGQYRRAREAKSGSGTEASHRDAAALAL
jgi:AraC-like DNA-binding protein